MAEVLTSPRIGNVFAISLALCFKTAVGIAYFQYLWNTLARTSVSFKCLNDSFDVNNSLRSLVSWELIHRIRVGTMVAIVLWYVEAVSSGDDTYT
jgi:hypothetical protein